MSEREGQHTIYKSTDGQERYLAKELHFTAAQFMHSHKQKKKEEKQ